MKICVSLFFSSIGWWILFDSMCLCMCVWFEPLFSQFCYFSVSCVSNCMALYNFLCWQSSIVQRTPYTHPNRLKLWEHREKLNWAIVAQTLQLSQDRNIQIDRLLKMRKKKNKMENWIKRKKKLPHWKWKPQVRFMRCTRNSFRLQRTKCGIIENGRKKLFPHIIGFRLRSILTCY